MNKTLDYAQNLSVYVEFSKGFDSLLYGLMWINPETTNQPLTHFSTFWTLFTFVQQSDEWWRDILNQSDFNEDDDKWIYAHWWYNSWYLFWKLPR